MELELLELELLELLELQKETTQQVQLTLDMWQSRFDMLFQVAKDAGADASLLVGIRGPLVSPLPQLVVLRSHTVFVPVQSLFVRFAVTKSLPTSLFARHLSNVLYVRSFKISSVTSDFNQLL